MKTTRGKTRLIFHSSQAIHPEKELQAIQGEKEEYWKLKCQEATFLIFKETMAEEIKKTMENKNELHIKKGEIRVVRGGTYLVILRIGKNGNNNERNEQENQYRGVS